MTSGPTLFTYLRHRDGGRTSLSPCLCFFMAHEKWDQISHAQDLRASHLCLCQQGQHHCICLVNSGPAFQRVAYDKGIGQLPHHLEGLGARGRTSFPYSHHHTSDREAIPSHAPLMPSEMAYLHICLPGQFYCATEVRCRAHSPECYS